MSHKTKMPEPVVLRTVMPNDYRYGHVYGYTASQMRAYANERVREAQTWEPIETAPKDGSRVLLRSPGGKMADGFWGINYGVWSWPYVMVEPTHWMPLPEPPCAT